MVDGCYFTIDVKKEEVKFGDSIKDNHMEEYLGKPIVETSGDKPRLRGWRTVCAGC